MDVVRTAGVLNEVMIERSRQDNKFGSDRNYTPEEWLMILGEEVGEANKAALEIKFKYDGARPELYREELVQVAAVAVAMIECFDRQIEASAREICTQEVNQSEIVAAGVDVY